jgi:very-short-patch-repair endonuclease
MTQAQRLLADALAASGFVVRTEFKFHETRRWRIDVAVSSATTSRKLAIEIDGGVWVQGRHTRGTGVMKDNEKIAHLAMDGWLFLRVTPQQVMTRQALAWALAILSHAE